MKSVPVVAIEEVRDDIQAAYDYFGSWSDEAADRFLERYFETTDRVAQNPEMFPTRFGDFRRALVPRTNLAVYFFIESERAVVVAVIDVRRRPSTIKSLVRGRRLAE